MSKRKDRQRKSKSSVPLSSRKRKVTGVIALLLCLSLAGAIFAQWRAGRLLTGTYPSLAPTPTVPPQSSPSKEYIYAGGRLIATEEPIPATSTLSAPTGFTAHATTPTQITLSWATTGAQSYLIEWSSNYSAANNGFTTRTTVDCSNGCTNTVSYTDSVPAGATTTYLYRVRSVSSSQQSSPSVFDFATTQSFSEQIQNQDPGRTTIRATHFLELTAAVNAVRAAAGLSPFTWTDPQGRAPGSGVPILKSHMQDLRAGLDQALGSLGLAPQAYSDQGLPAGTFVRKAHIDELRQRTKGVGQ